MLFSVPIESHQCSFGIRPRLLRSFFPLGAFRVRHLAARRRNLADGFEVCRVQAVTLFAVRHSCERQRPDRTPPGGNA